MSESVKYVVVRRGRGYAVSKISTILDETINTGTVTLTKEEAQRVAAAANMGDLRAWRLCL